jgi:molybdopterin-guanine dinucleotide biosynthesis protein A
VNAPGSRLVGAIVAGGASSRFGGAPKGLRTVGGQRIIDRVGNALRAVTSELILLSNADDAERWLPGVAVVRDERPERGSLVGLYTALTYTSSPILVVAWDMPFVNSELLELIVSRSVREPFATVPTGAEGPEPFCAAYAPACVPFVEAALNAGDLRMSSMLRRLPSVTLIPANDLASIGDPARLFFNVNTPHDLAVAEEMDAAR